MIWAGVPALEHGRHFLDGNRRHVGELLLHVRGRGGATWVASP